MLADKENTRRLISWNIADWCELGKPVEFVLLHCSLLQDWMVRRKSSLPAVEGGEHRGKGFPRFWVFLVFPLSTYPHWNSWRIPFDYVKTWSLGAPDFVICAIFTKVNHAKVDTDRVPGWLGEPDYAKATTTKSFTSYSDHLACSQGRVNKTILATWWIICEVN